MFKLFKAFTAADRLRTLSAMGIKSFGVILFAYLLADIITSAVVPPLLSSVLKAKNVGKRVAISARLDRDLNYHDLRKFVLNRNLFNKSGELPEEEDLSEEPTATAFDMSAPCQKTLLNIGLVGTIYRGVTGSIATIREQGIDTSDIYSVGDFIVGSDQAQIVAISRNQVVINNDGKKECLTLDTAAPKLAQQGKGGAQVERITLDSFYVEQQLGEGFNKIIQAARLIPNTEDNRVTGFKMFAIKKDSILDRIGFKENDVITKVNDVVLSAEQGFALFEQLQESREIRVQLLRHGKEPKTIIIKIE